MLQTSDSAIVQTLVAGGTEGAPFNDLVYLGWPAISPLNMEHPIVRIIVWYGRAINGLDITYLLKDGTTKEITHGAQTGKEAVINLGVDEVLIDVYGKAGFDSHYNRVVVSQISFVILDKRTAIARIAGPYGSGEAGSLYHDAGTAAFAGWVFNSLDRQAEIVGLSFWTAKTWE